MRWFKHDTDARNDVRIRLLKKQYGAEGYGVYFQLLEIIGEFVERDNIENWGSVDKFHTVETLAEECGVSTDRLREILAYCNKLDLFEKKNGRLYCDKILKRLDDYAQRAKNDAEKLPTKSEQSGNTLGTKSDIEKKRREEKRKEEILNTGDKRPENETLPRGMTSVGAILQEKEAAREVLVHGSTQKSGIATPWQDKAFRYADKLGIKLTGALTGRWMKVFKQASGGRKAANLEKAYSFLSDHPDRDTMQQEGLVNYFFWIYENGLQKQFRGRAYG